MIFYLDIRNQLFKDFAQLCVILWLYKLYETKGKRSKMFFLYLANKNVAKKYSQSSKDENNIEKLGAKWRR